MSNEDFKRKLEAYVDVIVEIGLNIQSGQRVLIENAPPDEAGLVRLIATKAYRRGARLVDVIFKDDQLTQIRLTYAPRDSFDDFSSWLADAPADQLRKGDALLLVSASRPGFYAAQDPEALMTIRRATMRSYQPVWDLMMSAASNWCVFGLPTAEWAAKVFPALPSDDQRKQLWDVVFQLCRVNASNPIIAWRNHLEGLAKRSEYLQQKLYSALQFVGPGTDLTVGLLPNHEWGSAQFTTQSGVSYVCNLPTEEVGTWETDPSRIEGLVTTTRPLNLGDTLIPQFSLTFEHGKVVRINAGRHERLLQTLIETDEMASSLGEAAFVPHSSPISQSGLVFYETLYDENASCHLALGARGSAVHVDFMIGSKQIDIDGILESGTLEPIMRGGEWAFDI